MDNLNDIREMYNAAWQGEGERLTVRHKLEADLTWRYLDQHLPSTGRILEVGFGTGFYTFPLVERGYDVLGVDLADEFVDGCTTVADEKGLSDRVTFQLGDARTLEGVPRNAFDAVLLMGPLYHLILQEDRGLALRCVHDCLKQGGILFSALISRYAVLSNLMRDTPHWIEDQAHVWSHIRDGHRPDDAPRGGFRGYFVRLDEIAPMHEDTGFETVEIAGVEPVIGADDESYNRLEGKQRELWLEALYEISREPSMVASSRHILYIGRKYK